MKKNICLLMLAVTLLNFAGCSQDEGDSVSFYYLRNEFSYGAENSVIISEQRELTYGKENLNYLLNLYLAGPLEDQCRTPFPKGTRLLNVLLKPDSISIYLSDGFSSLENIHLTLAGACIAATCFELTDAAAVQIFSGSTGSEPLITITRDSLTLLDSSGSVTENTSATIE